MPDPRVTILFIVLCVLFVIGLIVVALHGPF